MYKRQVSGLISASTILSERITSNTLNPKASANGSIVFMSGTVSYTHLDVYKRQVLYRVVLIVVRYDADCFLDFLLAGQSVVIFQIKHKIV